MIDMYQYLLALLIANAVFLVLWLLYNHDKSDTRVPPGRKGLPFIGETLDFIFTSGRGLPEKFINDRVEKYSSNIFYSSLLGEKMAIFCGPSGNKLLFSGHDKYFTTWWPKVNLKVILDPSNLAYHSSKKDGAYELRTLLLEVVSPESLHNYIPIMDTMAKKHLDEEWSPYGNVEVYPLSKKYTFILSSKLFMSLDDPKTIDNIARPFKLVATGLFSLPINFPGTRFNKAVKGAKKMRHELLAIIKERKLDMLKSKELGVRDLLTRMLRYRDKNGEPWTETNVADNIISTFLASHDTTSTAITFAINYLAEYPEVYQKVYEEQVEILKSKKPGELLNWNDMKKMKYSWNVVLESMRLQPPSSGSFKEVINSFTYEGYTIPKGWKVYWTVHSTNKNPTYFPKPEIFDPSRFEGDGPEPYTFVPFGGGRRMCPGREYARVEILAFIHNVVTRFTWEKMIPNEKINYIPTPVPMNNLPISLKPHKVEKTDQQY